MDQPKRILTVALACLIFISAASFDAEPQGKRVGPKVVEISPEELEEDATFVFERVSKSVVIVETETPDGKVEGSGVVYKTRSFGKEHFSFIVTNCHVIKNAESIFVLQGEKRFKAAIEYIDREWDLTLLSIKGVLLPASPLSSGAQLKIGERVFAIGTPLGLFENTISEGIISGKRTEKGKLFLQTTAPISRGSSGGGLFDTKGRLVGITTLKFAGGENLNFAMDAARISEIMSAQDAAIDLYISAKSSGRFTEDEMEIINSDVLTEWVLEMRAESGGRLSVWITERYSQIIKGTQPKSQARNAAFDKLDKENVEILERFLREQSRKAIGTKKKPEIVIKSDLPPASGSSDTPSVKKSKEGTPVLSCRGSDPAAILYCLESLAGIALPSRCIGITAEQISFCGNVLAAGRFDLSKGVVEPPDENYKEAILYYNIAIQVDVKYVPAYVARAEGYLKLGNYRQAIRDCDKALEFNPASDQAFDTRGLAYAKLHDYRQAIVNFDKAIELTSTHKGWPYGRAYSNRGDAYEKLGDVRRAIRDWITAAELGYSPAEAELRRRGINR